MTLEQLKNYPEYHKLSPAKQEFLMEIVRDSGKITADGMLPLLLKAQSRMNAHGIRFTNEESDFLTTVLMADLSPADRAKFEMLKKVMRKR